MDFLSELTIHLLGKELSTTSFIIVLLCGFMIGIAKTGLSGAGLAVVPLMAFVFGGKPSTGLLLPILIMADIFAVKYYNRHAQWTHIWKLLPWAFLGVVIGVLTGKYISDMLFNQALSFLVILGVVLMIWQDVRGDKLSIPNHWIFAVLMGLLGGFSTMIGNAAGSVMAIYLLAMRLPKNHFIGTGAWFFLIINVFKVPFHVFSWHTITWQTFLFDLLILPAILLGVFTGIKVVKRIPEKLFKILIIVTIIITAVFILIKLFGN